MDLRPNLTRLETMLRIATMAGDAAIADAQMYAVLDEIVGIIGCDRSTLYLLDPQTDRLWSRVLIGDGSFLIQLERGQGLAGWVVNSGVPLLVNDVLKDDRFDGRWDKQSGYQTESVLAVPMLDLRGQVMGVLQCLNKSGGFDAWDQKMLEGIAAICALATEAAALRQDVEIRGL